MFQNKTIWVIGATGDIAKAFLKRYHQYFGTLVLAGRNMKHIKAFCTKYSINDALVLPIDLCSKDSICAFISSAPKPDIVINFSGHLKYHGKTEDISMMNIEQTFQTNTVGTICLLEYAAAVMKENNSGTILTLSSCAGDRGKASNRIYSASKAAMNNYLQGLTQKYNKYGVNIINIKIGAVKTKMMRESKKSNFFAAEKEQTAGFIFEILCNGHSKTVYQPYWSTIMRVYRAIPTVLYNKLKF